MKKFFITTTIPQTLAFFKGNLRFLNNSFDVCVISSDKKILTRIAKYDKVRTFCIPMKREISLLSDLFCLLNFIVFFKKEKPDIVHGNTPKASLLSMLAAWITRVPVRVYMCHGLRYQGEHGWRKKLLVFMERLSCYCASEIICVSNGVKKTLITDHICNEKKAIVVGYGSANGIDLNYFSISATNKLPIRKDLGIANDSFVFIYVGRIVRDKGINELVHAFANLSLEKNIHLILIGPEEQKLDPVSEDTRRSIYLNQKIHYLGRKNDIRPFLLNSNAFVLPSYREGFGMVLAEANAMELPCITTDIIGCNEIIKDGKNGIIIPPHNEDALYEAMKGFVEHPERVQQMAKNARSMIRSRYEQKMVWNGLLNEYQRLYNKKK